MVSLYFKGDSIDVITINICFYYMITYNERNIFFKLYKVIINLMENLLFLRILRFINLIQSIA